jgi:PAS domain S-box-containing protein
MARHFSDEISLVSSISPDALMVVNRDRGIVMCNRSVARLFGYTVEETVGRTTDLLYSDRRVDKSRPREIYDALARDGFHVGVATGRRKDGSTFPLEIISAEVSGRDAAVLLLRDITERAEAERQRRILEDRVRQREKLESMGMMAAGVAHDFNNMLSVIIASSELGRIKADGMPPVLGLLDAIHQAAKQAADVCALMLAYAGKTQAKMQKADLSESVRRTVRLLRVSLGPHAKLSCHLASELPPVNADPTQLGQVTMNLILNARDAIGDKEGQILVQTSLRQCTAADLADSRSNVKLSPGPYVAMDVRDDGCGMDEATISRLFEPFFTTKENGRGLGLASVLGIVRAHGAAIQVDSQKGKGTHFTVLLPVGIEPQAAPPAAV